MFAAEFFRRFFVGINWNYLFHTIIWLAYPVKCYNLEVINLFRINKKEDIVVLDIRDNSVGGMILSLDKKGNSIPQKLFSIRKEIPFQRNFNHKRLFYLTAQAINHVSSLIMKSGFIKKPHKVFCIVGPHLHASQIRKIKTKYDSSVVISEFLLKNLVVQDIEHFEKKHLDIGGDSSNSVLEHKIMQLKLNGYETLLPINKHASEIEISVFVSMVPKILINDLSRIITKNLHTNKIDFHSFTFVLSDVVRSIALDKRGFVAINIEDEISEISVIRDGIVEDIASFPVGVSLLTRIIMDRFSVSHDQAISDLKLFVSGMGTSEMMSKMEEVADRTRMIWSDLFYQTMKKMSYRHLLPDTFYIVTEETCKDIFKEFIKKTDISNLLAANKPPRVECMEPKVFASLCKNISDCPDDLHFLVGAVFSDKFEKQQGSGVSKDKYDFF
jgi:hypothetical protein